MKVINFFAGPGAGKSTLAAGLFHVMKLKGYNVELVTEYAKDKVWEGSVKTLENQVYVFAKQLHRQCILRNNVDYVVTDSPILFSLIYGGPHRRSFRELVAEEFDNFDNINVFVKRTKEYVEGGRLQTEDEAIQIDARIKELLDGLRVPHISFGDYTKERCAEALFAAIHSHL